MAGTEGKGLYLSNNDGRTWAPAARQLADANLYAVAADPADSRRMATGGWGTGPWISRDGGEQWQRASDALPSENITAMAFDANVAGRLWVSTFEEGTYFTDDFGKTWQSGDLDGAYVFDLGFVPVSD